MMTLYKKMTTTFRNPELKIKADGLRLTSVSFWDF